jgi:4'-phosphopantetheinyl transferase
MTESLGLDLAPGVVHVWRIRLDVSDALAARFELTLATQERERADRFRTAELRRRFVAGRGALRAILGAHLGLDARLVVFSYGDRGKPSLATPGVEFNLAHTDDLALCALTVGRAVGVDVERLRPMDDAERIIARYFTPRERLEFLEHPRAERASAFFRGWTRKEAFLKATGEGLTASLDSFEVSLEAGGARLLRVGDDPDAACRWSLVDVDVEPGFVAALAVEGPIEAILVRDWAPEP